MKMINTFYWSNCQPLLITKNLSKGAKRNLWSEVMQELKANGFLKVNYLLCAYDN